MSTRVALHHGTPTLFVDGQPTFASYMWASPPSPDEYPLAPAARVFAKAGIHFYAFDVGTGGTFPEWGPHGFDFSTLEARFGKVLEADPEARFHLRVYLEMGPHAGWWHERHPDECEVDSQGQVNTQSFASAVWREQCQDFLRAYAAHLGRLGLGDRVIAYQTGAGHTGEWCKGLTSMRQPCGDYGPAMRRHFRAWLRQRYGQVQSLRQAWGDPAADFDAVEVPSEAAQLNTLHQSFRDPTREQPVIDYYRCLAELCADLIIDFNRTVKEATGGNTMAGAFYGYLLDMAWNAGFFSEGPDSEYSTLQRSGHLGLARVLRSPYVDFLASPYGYGFRGIGGHGAGMPPSESLRLHGKLYLFEDDTRTHLAPPDAGFGRARNLGESSAVLKRNFAEVLTRGQGIWWLGENSHISPVREPAFAPLLRRFQQLGTFGLKLDRKPASQIAVLVDDESFLYESVRNDLDIPLIFQQRLWGLPRLGAPADYYLLQDLLEGRLPPYKLYLFLNAFHLDATRRRDLALQIRRDGRVAAWIYAPGYLEEGPALEHMEGLTGFRYGKGEHAWGPVVHITDFEHPITRGLAQDLSWGTNSRLGPVFHLEDPEARILGQVVYSQGRCLPGMGVKTFPEWTSVYLAAPNVPAPVLRGLARFAGVHLYSEAGDVLYATRQLLAVHTVAGGERAFSLPAKAEVVYDLFAEQAVARRAAHFQVGLEPVSTALYYTGPEALLQELPTGEEG
jgi:hypothetical protein